MKGLATAKDYHLLIAKKSHLFGGILDEAPAAFLNAQMLSKAVILVQHSDQEVRRNLRTLLESWGCLVFGASEHTEAAKIIEQFPIQVALIAPRAHDQSEFRIMQQLRLRKKNLQILLIGSLQLWRNYEDSLALGAAGVVINPVRVPELKSQLLHILREIHEQSQDYPIPPRLRIANDGGEAGELAQLVITATQLHHDESAGHIRRIGKFSQLLAELAGCDGEFAAQLGEAALLHDIGKLAIPDEIIRKPGPLSPEEFEIMKTHTVLGGEILHGSQTAVMKLAHTVAIFHHERWDGSGYPGNLRGDACPFEARIVGIVDVFDALCADRVYKKTWAPEKIQDFFKSHRNTAFEGKLVDLLLEHYSLFHEMAQAAATPN